MGETDLTTIHGVGAATADALRDAGFDTVSDVANAPFTDLEAVSGLGETGAREVAYNALSLVHERDVGATTDTAGADPTETPVVDGGGVTVSIDIDADVVPFVLHAMYEELLEQHKRRDVTQKAEAMDCARAIAIVARSHGTDTLSMSDTTHTYELDISPAALTTMYRGLSRTASHYASERGISQAYGRLRAVAEQVDEYR